MQTYAITGKTGKELYDSIGAHGPGNGNGRAIAHTSFKLTWTRSYVPQADGACTLVSARPKLIITYLLPRPASPLPAALGGKWKTFIAGVHKHERVHGDSIKAMVTKIEAASVGLSVPDDPDCRRIRTVLTAKLGDISQAQRREGRDFDRVELSDGGNIQQLILGLVNP